MPILSPEFAVFFLLFMLVYWSFQAVPKAQNWLLLVANIGLLFYVSYRSAVPDVQKYNIVISVVAFSLVMTFIGVRLQKEKKAGRRKYWLSLGIIFSLSVLGFFKYHSFFLPVLYSMGYDDIGTIFIPLGLSYYVFQSIAYLMGIFRGIAPALRWHELLLHFSFFLTITSGPIIRADRFKSIDGVNLGATEQIRRQRHLLQPALAVSLILLGTAKTWWFSGYIAESFVEPVFNNPMQYNVAAILAAVYGYTLELFFDFSGYSDLVIGLALLLGFRLPWNFRAPLYAVNIKDFWARWHITLSTWIRDYIYIPLGGSRKGFFRTQVNLFIAFTLSGIWHGDTINFLIWGALHGLALVFLHIKQYFFPPARPSQAQEEDEQEEARPWWQTAKKYLSIFITFNFVCFAFVVFKITTLAELQAFFTALFLTEAQSTYGDWLLILIVLAGIAAYPQWINLFQRFVAYLQELPLSMWVVIIILVLQIIIICAPAGIPGFIYADF